MIDIDNFLHYSDQAKRQLSTFAYYLSYLKNEVKDEKEYNDLLNTIEGIGNKINDIQLLLISEEEKLEEAKEASKTEEQKKLDQEIEKIKRIYYEETGQHLLLSDKDVIQNVKDEISKLKTTRTPYQAPQVEWETFIDKNKNDWVKGVRERLENIHKEKYSKK